MDLSAYAGQTITLRFQSDEDTGLQTSFWLDDVALTTTDTTGPNGGSVDASGLAGTGSRYATSTTLSLVLDKGGDPSGVAATGNTLSRATATLTGGTCGTFGTYTLVTGGTDPVSPKSDTVSDQACYSYRYVVKDTLGNSTTYTSPDIKVDLTAPAAPSLAFSVFTNTWWPGSGTTVYYRSAAASGSVTDHRDRDRRGLGDRELRVPGARHQLDLHAGRPRGQHLQLVRRPGRAGHQEGHGHQQRRRHVGELAVHHDGG